MGWVNYLGFFYSRMSCEESQKEFYDYAGEIFIIISCEVVLCVLCVVVCLALALHNI